MSRADGRNPGCLVDDLWLCRLVAIERSRRGATRQDARGKGSPDDDRDAFFLAELQLAVERLLLEQGVGHRHQEEVDIAALKEARNHADVIDAGADRLDLAPRLEIGQRLVSALVAKLMERLRNAFLRLLMPWIQIVDQKCIDPVEAQPRETVLVALEHTVARVVEARLEWQPSDPARMRVFVRVRRAQVNASDLGGEHEAVTRLGSQHAAEAQLALAVAVPGRGVEIADARGVRGFERRFGLVFWINLAGVAEARAAHAQLRDHEIRFGHAALLERIHSVLLLIDEMLRGRSGRYRVRSMPSDR